jgi:hypothetical protein
MPEHEPKHQRDEARARQVTALFYLLSLGIFEIATGTTGSFVVEVSAASPHAGG